MIGQKSGTFRAFQKSVEHDDKLSASFHEINGLCKMQGREGHSINLSFKCSSAPYKCTTEMFMTNPFINSHRNNFHPCNDLKLILLQNNALYCFYNPIPVVSFRILDTTWNCAAIIYYYFTTGQFLTEFAFSPRASFLPDNNPKLLCPFMMTKCVFRHSCSHLKWYQIHFRLPTSNLKSHFDWRNVSPHYYGLQICATSKSFSSTHFKMRLNNNKITCLAIKAHKRIVEGTKGDLLFVVATSPKFSFYPLIFSRKSGEPKMRSATARQNTTVSGTYYLRGARVFSEVGVFVVEVSLNSDPLQRNVVGNFCTFLRMLNGEVFKRSRWHNWKTLIICLTLRFEKKSTICVLDNPWVEEGNHFPFLISTGKMVQKDSLSRMIFPVSRKTRKTKKVVLDNYKFCRNQTKNEKKCAYPKDIPKDNIFQKKVEFLIHSSLIILAKDLTEFQSNEKLNENFEHKIKPEIEEMSLNYLFKDSYLQDFTLLRL
ncbi:hypothetical protein EGR_01951 [Echinococcus granulosus]|uniref:Uncharacterized protein n=1 Tax=Echinococcus granulosus TaxID=6210 RepID=W6UX84_ECHGR|nr:hypothetical protein EGR_01951 [Echinococcus granulosus]EUB63147.1 hypothetical protein EGR_01951 [Echinococcus granulosus]